MFRAGRVSAATHRNPLGGPSTHPGLEDRHAYEAIEADRLVNLLKAANKRWRSS